jgi:hypothetical protein
MEATERLGQAGALGHGEALGIPVLEYQREKISVDRRYKEEVFVIVLVLVIRGFVDVGVADTSATHSALYAQGRIKHVGQFLNGCGIMRQRNSRTERTRCHPNEPTLQLTVCRKGADRQH